MEKGDGVYVLVGHYGLTHSYGLLSRLTNLKTLNTPLVCTHGKKRPSSLLALIHFFSISARLMPPLKAFLARACWSCQRVRAPSMAAPSFAATTVVYVMPKARGGVLVG
jgi:hypothetical protein